jgi:Nucleoside-diphosphate-sugar epimerases
MNGYRSLYGSSKFSSELFIHEFGKYKKLKYLINRCGMIAGPWQMGKFDQGIISYWVSSHIYKRELKYIGYSGTGKQVRDVLHIDDLCILIDKQINNWSKLESKVFNVGGGKSNSISLLELTEIVNTVTGIKIPILKEEKTRDADIRIFITNSQRIRDVLRWEPTIGLKRIVRDTSEWILKNKNNLEGIL